MLTSGIFDDLYVVNEKYYQLQDDMICFRLSKMYHSLPENYFITENFYETKYGKIENTEGNKYLIYWYDEYKPFTSKFRVYKIQNI
jgi:hypothetical protein